MMQTQAVPRGTTGVSQAIRYALGFFVFLLIYDGALRKWVLPGAEQLLFILKDAFLAFTLAFLLVPGRRYVVAAQLPPISGLLLNVYCFWVVADAFNINLPNIAVGVWGIKSHLLYAALLILVPVAFRDLDSLLAWCIKLYPWLVVPPCALAFLQLTSSPDSFVNQQVRGGLDMIAYFGDESLVRVAGPFSYVTGMACFVQAAVVLGVGLFISGARSPKFLLGLGFCLAALPATGSRSVVVIGITSVLLMLFAGKASRLISLRTSVSIAGALAALAVVGFLAQDSAWTALQERTRNISELQDDSSRAVTAFTGAFEFMEESGFAGFGSGAASLGSSALAPGVQPFSWLPGGDRFEEESGRLVLELGIVGWLISLSLRISFLVWSLALLLGARGRSPRAAGLIALPVMALGVHSGNGIFAPPIAPSFYWFCVALLAMARYQESEIRRRAVAVQPGAPGAAASAR